MKNIIVVDNFYQEPEKIRDYALNKVHYLPKEKLSPNFAGTESIQSFSSAALKLKIQKAVGMPLIINPSKFSFGVFAKTYKSDQSNNEVHVDSSQWTGLVYLNLPQQCQGGTHFYEHKNTRMHMIPEDQSDLVKLGYYSKADFVQRFLRPQSKESSAWNTTVKIGMRFNRLVLFKAGHLFHSAGNYFGDNDETCRLTQLFFFSTEGTK